MCFCVTLGVLVALTGAGARAQHGTAPPGAYPRLYQGETWTGYVTHTDAKTRRFTLTSVQGGKAEQFVGVLRGDYKVKTPEGVHELTVSDFPMACACARSTRRSSAGAARSGATTTPFSAWITCPRKARRSPESLFRRTTRPAAWSCGRREPGNRSKDT